MNRFHHTLPLWQWPSQYDLRTPESHDLLEALLELDQLLEALQERLGEPESH